MSPGRECLVQVADLPAIAIPWREVRVDDQVAVVQRYSDQWLELLHGGGRRPGPVRLHPAMLTALLQLAHYPIVDGMSGALEDRESLGTVARTVSG